MAIPLACKDSIRRRRRVAAIKASKAAKSAGKIGRVVEKDGFPYFKETTSPLKKCKKRRRCSGVAAHKIFELSVADRCKRRRLAEAHNHTGYMSGDSTNSKRFPMYNPDSDSDSS